MTRSRWRSRSGQRRNHDEARRQGEDVRKLQQDLVELGYDLPRGGADGDLGCETLVAVARFLCDHGTDDDDANVVSDAELALVQEVLAETRGMPAGPQPAGVPLLDPIDSELAGSERAGHSGTL